MASSASRLAVERGPMVVALAAADVGSPIRGGASTARHMVPVASAAHAPKGPLTWTPLGVRSPPSAGDGAARPTGCSAGGTRRGNSTNLMSPQVDASFRGSAPLPCGVVSLRVTSSIRPDLLQCRPRAALRANRMRMPVLSELHPVLHLSGCHRRAHPIQDSGVNRDGVNRFLGLRFIRCTSLAAFSYTRTGGLAT
jgi:hypothetical protein